jgi:hypothetical protein
MLAVSVTIQPDSSCGFLKLALKPFVGPMQATFGDSVWTILPHEADPLRSFGEHLRAFRVWLHVPLNLVRDFEKRAAKPSDKFRAGDASDGTKASDSRARQWPAWHHWRPLYTASSEYGVRQNPKRLVSALSEAVGATSVLCGLHSGEPDLPESWHTIIWKFGQTQRE